MGGSASGREDAKQTKRHQAEGAGLWDLGWHEIKRYCAAAIHGDMISEISSRIINDQISQTRSGVVGEHDGIANAGRRKRERKPIA